MGNNQYWSCFKDVVFTSEEDKILWDIFNKIFNQKASKFVDILNDAFNGNGYSPFEYYGYSLYDDLDKEEHYPFVLIYCDRSTYEISTKYFLYLLRLACDYYVYIHPYQKNTVYNKYDAIFEKFNKAMH